MQGAHEDATGAYMEIREDRSFVGNAADGPFLEVSPCFSLIEHVSQPSCRSELF